MKRNFISYYVQNGVIHIQCIDTDHQWADISTKPLAIEMLYFIKRI